MAKLNIKELVKFKRSSKRGRQNIAYNLKNFNEKKQENQGGGGNYWVCATSALKNSFKLNHIQPIQDKKRELEEKFLIESSKRTKEMYERNLSILYSFEDVETDRWRPAKEMKFLPQSKDNIIVVHGIQLQVDPTLVFEYERDGRTEVGAIWFVAQLNGFSKDELGMFAESMWRYLHTHYAKDRIVNPQYCIAVDIFSGQEVRYLQPEENGVPMILNSTVKDIIGLM